MKNAIVTGAGRGIGRAIALELASEGYTLALLSRSVDQLEHTARLCRERGAVATLVAEDLADTACAERAANQAIAELTSVHVLVNAAGISMSATIPNTTPLDFDRLYAVNVRAPFIFMQAALAGMREQKYGRIINIASTAGLRGASYIAAYAASKHALVGLSKVAAAEYARHGVTVNAICPGYVDTDMTGRTIEHIVRKTGRSASEARAELERMNPQGRLLDVSEVAKCALYLVSDAAAGINGQSISICGGELL